MVVGLDIGTSNIRAAIGVEDENGNIQIAGIASQKSSGLRNGVVVNIEDAMNAIKQTIEAAEQNAGMEVRSCFTGIGGGQIESFNQRGNVAVTLPGKQRREITAQDKKNVLDNATAIIIPLDREMLHVIPQSYIVDGFEEIKDPIHMMAVRLEANVNIVTASKTSIQNVKACMQRAGYELDGVMLKTLAASTAVLHEDEEELGSILIDMGAGTTDVLVLVKGSPVCSLSIPVGGNLVTNDISIVKAVPTAIAERIKIESGCCWLPSLREDSEVIIPGVGGRAPEQTSQSELCQIIQPRVEEIFTMVRSAVARKTNLTQLSGNIVLVGGCAQMEGVVELAENVFGTSSVRLGIPENFEGLESFRNPEYATVVGLIIANKNKAAEAENKKSSKMKRSVTSERNGKEGFFTRLKKAFF